MTKLRKDGNRQFRLINKTLVNSNSELTIDYIYIQPTKERPTQYRMLINYALIINKLPAVGNISRPKRLLFKER